MYDQSVTLSCWIDFIHIGIKIQPNQNIMYFNFARLPSAFDGGDLRERTRWLPLADIVLRRTALVCNLHDCLDRKGLTLRRAAAAALATAKQITFIYEHVHML